MTSLRGLRQSHVPAALPPVGLRGLESNTAVHVAERGSQACFGVILQNKFSLPHRCPSGTQLGATGTGYYCAEPARPCHALLLGFWVVTQCLDASAPCLSCGTAGRRMQHLKNKQLA